MYLVLAVLEIHNAQIKAKDFDYRQRIYNFIQNLPKINRYSRFRAVKIHTTY